MTKIDLFPKSVVTGEAFCDRSKERKQLATYILTGRHVWLQAHRRHGRASLVAKTIEDVSREHKVAYSCCHLRFASDVESTIKKITQSIDGLISQILMASNSDDAQGVSIQRMTDILHNTFRQIKPSIMLHGTQPIISITEVYDLSGLEDAFYGLDKLAAAFGVRATLMIDEYQEIGKVKKGIEIESVIHQAVENLHSTTVIFSGSEKALMQQAMDDNKRPFSNQLQPVLLNPISATAYRTWLNQFATDKWGKNLSKVAFSKIMLFTQRHPYYVNALCAELWESDKTPTEQCVMDSWDEIVSSYSKEDAYEIRSLTPNDKKVVISIAKGSNTKMTSASVSIKLGIAASSISFALDSLVKRDIIDKNKEVYFIVNPALAALLERE